MTARPKRKDRPVVRMTFEREKRKGSMASGLRVCAPADEFHAMDLEDDRPLGISERPNHRRVWRTCEAKSAELRGAPMSLQLCGPSLRE